MISTSDNAFNKLTGYKLNIKKKSVVFLYTSDRHTQKEAREAMPFIANSKYIP